MEIERSEYETIRKSEQARDIQKKKQSARMMKPQSVKVSETRKSCSVSRKKQSHDIVVETKKIENPRSQTREAMEIDGSKSFVVKPIQKKKPSILLKKQHPMKVSEAPKCCPTLKKNSTEVLELFEIAKKSADLANAKGLMLSQAETSICVDTLSLLLSFSISSSAPETRKIMEKLGYLTRHKNRKICNSASALYDHWRQCITRDQQRG